MSPWTTGSPPAGTLFACKRSATGSGPCPSAAFSSAGFTVCRRRLPLPTGRPGSSTTLAFRQIEFSDTGVFDRLTAGRAWFETTIREHLDRERPDQVALVFSWRIDRRTPGGFATRVIARGVDPSIQIHYRSSKQKQYVKESEALRTETTINDTHDFGAGCLVTNGVGAPGLRFGDPRVVALLASLVSFTHVVAGFTNATLRSIVEGHLGRPYTSRQMGYDLRRLTRKGLITREKGTHRYRLTPEGRRLSMFFTKIYTRIVTPSPRYLKPQASLRR